MIAAIPVTDEKEEQPVGCSFTDSQGFAGLVQKITITDTRSGNSLTAPGKIAPPVCDKILCIVSNFHYQ